MWREHLRIAARALSANRFRSSLTVFSIFIGAFLIVLMSSLANSGLTSLAQDIENLGGARIILVMPRKPTRVPDAAKLPRGRFSRRDVEVLFDALPHIEGATVYAALDAVDVRNQKQKAVRSDFVAADAAFFNTLELKPEKGRIYSSEEARRRSQVCVVGHRTAKKLFGGTAVGKYLIVDGLRCHVIGQLSKVDHWDVNFGFDWVDFVAMPLDTLSSIRPETRKEAVIHLRTAGTEHNDIVKRVTNAILADRHRGVDDYQIWDFSSFMSQFEVIFLILEVVVGLIAGIALLVGGIGVMNMMLVSVTERTREIGIRKALGASPKMISRQFLIEAVFLASSGGVFGTALGVLAAIAFNRIIQMVQPIWVSEVSLGAVFVAFLMSMLVGVGFGYMPARKAARLDPVEAIRR